MVAETKQRGRPRKMLEPKPGKDEMFIPIGSKPKTIKDAMASVHKTGAYTGFLADGDIIRNPDMPSEVLDKEGKAQKQAIQSILLGVINPNPLSSRSTVEIDRRSLANKLAKSSLADLRRLLPDTIKEMASGDLQAILANQAQLTEEEKTQIQELYKEVSP